MDIINYIPFIVLIVPLIIIPYFIYLVKNRDVKLESELNIECIHNENCGGRFNSFNYTIPFIRFSIYDDFIVISYSKKILLYYHNISKVEVKSHLFTKGLHIHHNNPNIPKKIIIWSFTPEKAFNIIINKLKNVT